MFKLIGALTCGDQVVGFAVHVTKWPNDENCNRLDHHMIETVKESARVVVCGFVQHMEHGAAGGEKCNFLGDILEFV